MTTQVQQSRTTSSIARRVVAAIRTHDLLKPGNHILVAVSGGADSVALLSLMSSLADSWALTLTVLHVNHGLRGSEAREDATFVSKLCKQFGLRFVCKQADLALHPGRKDKRSLQERAREARYAIFSRVAAELGADKVALGHTADDQAETLLMWMLRGSGTAGLAGIPPVRGTLFIRPLLDLSRTDLLAYLRTQGLSFREDSSNAKPVYLRNRVRHELLPALERFNPNIRRVLQRQADILREEDLYLEQSVVEKLARLVRDEVDGSLTLDRGQLLALPLALQRRALRMLIRRMSGKANGPSFRAVADLLSRVVHGRSGSAISVHGLTVSREYLKIRLRPRASGPGSASGVPVDHPSTSMALSNFLPCSLTWPLTGQVIRLRDGASAAADRLTDMKPSTTIALLDADCFTLDLTIRSWMPGDAFQPIGMGGHQKKLQDYFSDIKLPRPVRQRVPLLVAPEGILWIVGHRVDQRFGATSSTTRRIIAELVEPAPSSVN